MESVPVTRKIIDYIMETNYESIPSEVKHQAKRALLDYFAVAIVGSTTEVSKKFFNCIKRIDTGDSCSVVGRKEKLSMLYAAMANGTSAHSLDFDDGHRGGSVHPGGVIFPAVLAAVEAYQLPPKQVLLGAVIGFDITTRLAAAMHPNAVYRGFHNTPVAGVLGATAAIAKILGLKKEQVQNAMGMAGSFSGGLFAFMQNGADIKRMHPGKAARDGLLCAELARENLTGPPEVIEGKNGFFQCFAGKADLSKLLNGLGTDYEIMNIYMKPYPACRHLHPAIDCVLKIKEKTKLKLEQIKKIKIGTYKVASAHAHKTYRNLLETQMSIPCAVASAIVHNEITLEAFLPETFEKNKKIQKLIEIAEVFIDDDCEKAYPQKRPTKVCLELDDGTVIMEKVDEPRGSKETPLSDKEIETKLINYCSPVIGKEKCKLIIKNIWCIEDLKELLFKY